MARLLLALLLSCASPETPMEMRVVRLADLRGAGDDEGIPWIPDGWKVSPLGAVADPRSVCALPDGRVLAGTADGKIACLHPDGTRSDFASGFDPVMGLAFDGGRVYVLHGARLSALAEDGARSELFTVPEAHRPARGLEGPGADGFLYIRGKGVLRLRPDGSDAEPCLGDVLHLVPEPDAARITLSGRELVGGVPGEFRPVALAVLPNGFLVADATGGRILRFTGPAAVPPRPEDPVQALSHPDAGVRLAAQRELAARKAVKELQAVLASGPDGAKIHALWALDALGVSVAGALGDPATVAQAARALGARRSEDAVPALLAHVHQPEAEWALGHIGRAKPAAWPAILKGLEVPVARDAVLRAARRGGGEAALLEAAQDAARADEVRAAAVSGLERPPGSLLRDPRPKVRAAAVAAGLAPADSLAELFASEADVDVRRAILGRAFPGAGAIAAKLLDDGSGPLFADAARAAGRAGGREATFALRRALRTGTSREVLVPAIEGAARLARPPVADLQKFLGHEDPAVVVAAIGAFAAMGGPGAVSALGGLVDDRPVEVRKAAIAALGTLRDQETHPHLFRASLVPETRREAIAAAAREPDQRALDLYIEGLMSGNADCGRAIAFFGTKSLDTLERRAAANALPRETLLALQRLYAGARPVARWLVLAPLPPADEPPFDVTVNDGGLLEGNFQASYPGVGGREVAWRTIDAAADGVLDLSAEAVPRAVAYAYASWQSKSDRPVVLRAATEGPLTVWLNGRKVLERAASRVAREEERIEGRFQAGTNYLMLKVAPGQGGWSFSLRAPEAGPFLERRVSKRDPAEMLRFALATAGDAARGAKLFADPKGPACARCHAMGEEGGDAGPSLARIGARLGRRELAESLLEPARSVPAGHALVRILTRQAHFVEGALREETLDQLTLSDREGYTVRVIALDVVKRMPVAGSLMPSALNSGLSPQDFADLLGYLESLR